MSSSLNRSSRITKYRGYAKARSASLGRDARVGDLVIAWFNKYHPVHCWYEERYADGGEADYGGA